MVEAGETLRLACKRRRGRHFVDDEFEHAVVEQAHQTEPFRDRNDVVRRDQAAVGAPDAHQALVERGPPVSRRSHGLVGEKNAPLVERGDDLVGRAHIVAAQRFALDIGPVGQERAATPGLGGVEALLRAGKNFRHAAGVTRRRDPADRDGDRDRSGAGRHHLIANRR